MDKQGHFEKGKWISPECEECSERHRLNYESLVKGHEELDSFLWDLSDYQKKKIGRFEKMNLWQRLWWAITGRTDNHG